MKNKYAIIKKIDFHTYEIYYCLFKYKGFVEKFDTSRRAYIWGCKFIKANSDRAKHLDMISTISGNEDVRELGKKAIELNSKANKLYADDKLNEGIKFAKKKLKPNKKETDINKSALKFFTGK